MTPAAHGQTGRCMQNAPARHPQSPGGRTCRLRSRGSWAAGARCRHRCRRRRPGGSRTAAPHIFSPQPQLQSGCAWGLPAHVVRAEARGRAGFGAAQPVVCLPVGLRELVGFQPLRLLERPKHKGLQGATPRRHGHVYCPVQGVVVCHFCSMCTQFLQFLQFGHAQAWVQQYWRNE
jgi:hypothetical protein